MEIKIAAIMVVLIVTADCYEERDINGEIWRYYEPFPLAFARKEGTKWIFATNGDNTRLKKIQRYPLTDTTDIGTIEGHNWYTEFTFNDRGLELGYKLIKEGCETSCEMRLRITTSKTSLLGDNFDAFARGDAHSLKESINCDIIAIMRNPKAAYVQRNIPLLEGTEVIFRSDDTVYNGFQNRNERIVFRPYLVSDPTSATGFLELK